MIVYACYNLSVAVVFYIGSLARIKSENNKMKFFSKHDLGFTRKNNMGRLLTQP